MDQNSTHRRAIEPAHRPSSGGLLSDQGWLFRDRVGDSGIPWAVLTIMCGVLTQVTRDSVATVSSMLQIIESIGSNIGTAVFVAFVTARFIPGTPISVESGYSNLFLTKAWLLILGIV